MKKITTEQYAKALYPLIGKKDNAEKIISELETIQKYFMEFPVFFNHIAYSSSSIDEKYKEIKSVFSEEFSELTYKIILILIRNEHLPFFEKIILDMKKLKKEDENILDAVIITPFALEEKYKSKLITILQDKTGKKIDIKEILDKNTIGGIKIKISDVIIDGTIAGRIEKLKQNIAML